MKEKAKEKAALSIRSLNIYAQPLGVQSEERNFLIVFRVLMERAAFIFWYCVKFKKNYKDKKIRENKRI